MLLLEETARKIGNQGQGERTDLSQKSAKSDYDWRKEVGEEIGVSHDTVQKGTDVYRFAYQSKTFDSPNRTERFSLAIPYFFIYSLCPQTPN